MEVPPCASVTSQEDLVSPAPSGKLAVDYLVPASAGFFFQYRGLNVRAWEMEAFYRTNRSALVAAAC